MNIGHYKAALAGAIASQFALIAFMSIHPGPEGAVKPGMRAAGKTLPFTEPVPTASAVNEEVIIVSREELVYLIEVAVNRTHGKKDDETDSETVHKNNDTDDFNNRDFNNQDLAAQEVNDEINQLAIEGEMSLNQLSSMLAKMEHLNEGDRNALTTELIRNINQQKMSFETTY